MEILYTIMHEDVSLSITLIHYLLKVAVINEQQLKTERKSFSKYEFIATGCLNTSLERS